MSEGFYFFDDARLPSEEPDERGISAEDSYNLLGQYGAFTPVFGLPSPLPGEDVPQPSIEMDPMENESHGGMFVTPDPDEGRLRYSMSLSIHNTPPGDFQMLSPGRQDTGGDCRIVDEEDCSPEAREKWLKSKSKHGTSAGRNFGDFVIKVEPGLGRARPANLVDIQKRLIAQHNATRLRKSGASTIFSSRTRPINLTPSPRTKPKPRRGTLHQQRSLDDIVDVKEEFQSIMRREEDDVRWMEQNDDDGGTEELETLKMLKRSFEQQQKSKDLSEAETIELMKVNQQIELQRRRKEAMERNNMFISSDDEEEDGSERLLRQSLYSQAAEDEHMARTTERDFVRETEVPIEKQKLGGIKKPTKGRGRKVAKTAREVEQNRREKEREKQRKKRARAANSKRAPLKGKGSKKSGKSVGPKGKKAYKSHMKAGWGGAGETLQTLMQDLIHNDFVADRQAQGDYGEAPEIHETTKEKALRALLASVPADYDTHKAKADKSDLKEASKRFGYGRVKNVDGRWKLSGMKSPL
jgi:hypothetical protein